MHVLLSFFSIHTNRLAFVDFVAVHDSVATAVVGLVLALYLNTRQYKAYMHVHYVVIYIHIYIYTYTAVYNQRVVLATQHMD